MPDQEIFDLDAVAPDRKRLVKTNGVVLECGEPSVDALIAIEKFAAKGENDTDAFITILESFIPNIREAKLTGRKLNALVEYLKEEPEAQAEAQEKKGEPVAPETPKEDAQA